MTMRARTRWTKLYEQAHARDDYDECERIDAAYDAAYDVAADEVGEDAPDEVFDEARFAAALRALAR